MKLICYIYRERETVEREQGLLVWNIKTTTMTLEQIRHVSATMPIQGWIVLLCD